MDEIDGLSVRPSGRARKAAVAAGRALGNPALAHAFRLDQLYRSRASAPRTRSQARTRRRQRRLG